MCVYPKGQYHFFKTEQVKYKYLHFGTHRYRYKILHKFVTHDRITWFIGVFWTKKSILHVYLEHVSNNNFTKLSPSSIPNWSLCWNIGTYPTSTIRVPNTGMSIPRKDWQKFWRLMCFLEEVRRLIAAQEAQNNQHVWLDGLLFGSTRPCLGGEGRGGVWNSHLLPVYCSSYPHLC